MIYEGWEIEASGIKRNKLKNFKKTSGDRIKCQLLYE